MIRGSIRHGGVIEVDYHGKRHILMQQGTYANSYLETLEKGLIPIYDPG